MGEVLGTECPVKQAVLLVGGLGTRLRPLTYLRPKAVMPVMNRPLIAYEIELLARHGVTDIVLAVGYEASALRETLGDGSRWGVTLTYREDPKPLGTAGPLRNVMNLLQDTFFCMNGDLIFDLDLAAMATEHRRSGAMVTLALRQVEDISPFGLIQCDATGRVAAFKEKVPHDETGRNTVNFGVYAMSREAVLHIPEGRAYMNEHDLFPDLLATGHHLQGYLPKTAGYWTDVGRLETYLQANRDLLTGSLPWVRAEVADSAAREGARLVDPVDVAAGVVLGAGAEVGPNAVIGEGCRVGRGAWIKDSVLCPGASVGEGALLAGSIAAWGARIGAGARHEGGVVMPPEFREPGD